jgi:aspartyl-tRNA(Asn)/glutamyl-tRNA(Gln) amidotransferase subunit A
MVERVQEMAIRHVFADACLLHRDQLTRAPESFSPAVLDRMTRGLEFTAVELAEAIRYKRRWKHVLRAVFETVDILASPTIPVVAPPVDEGRSLFEASKDLARNTYVGAFGGLPGLSVPCGFGADGMPIGLQLEAPWQEEGRLLTAGHAFQQETEFHRRRPVLGRTQAEATQAISSPL